MGGSLRTDEKKFLLSDFFSICRVKVNQIVFISYKYFYFEYDKIRLRFLHHFFERFQNFPDSDFQSSHVLNTEPAKKTKKKLQGKKEQKEGTNNK